MHKRNFTLFLFVVLVATYAYFYQSTQHNEAARFDQTRAILDEHRFNINSFAYNTADVAVMQVRGQRQVFPAKAPGSSFLALIPVAVIRSLVNFLHVPSWMTWHIIAYLTTVLTVSIPSALAAVAMYDIAACVVKDRRTAFLSIIAIWLGTILFPFSTLYFGHAQTAALLVGSFWILFRLRHDTQAFTRPRLMLCLAGILAGFAVVNEYPALLIAILLALYLAISLWRSSQLSKSIPFIIGAVGMGILLLAYNLAAFGQPFFSAYQALGQGGSSFAGQALGFAGIHWPGLRMFLDVLWRILIDPQRGLLYINPVLFLAIGGFFVWYRRHVFRLELALVSVITVLSVMFVACYGNSIVYWGGGASTGPRQLIMLLPFLVLPIGFAVFSWRRFLVPLLFFSAFCMLLATAVEPRIPYEYANPLFDFLIPHFLGGQFGLNRDGLFDATHHGVVGLSTAANLGGVLGLPGILQLVPLLGLWGYAGIRFLRIFKSPYPWFACVALVAFLLVIGFAPVIHRDAQGFPDAASAGLTAQYWNHDTFDADPVITRQEKIVDENWRAALPLAAPFSVRWSGRLHITKPGQYVFFLESDDGARLIIDNRIIMDDWGPHGVHRSDKALTLSAGSHPMTLEYHNSIGGGVIRFAWRTPDHPEETVPARIFLGD